MDSRHGADLSGDVPEVVRLALEPLGRAFNAVCIYGPRHPRTVHQLDASLSEFQPLIASAGPISINLADGKLRVNGREMPAPLPWMRMLKTRMTSSHVEGFCITPQAGTQGFSELLALLATGRPGELNDQLEQHRIPGVGPSRIQIRAVDASETVVDKAEAGREPGHGAVLPKGMVAGPAAAGLPVLDLDEGAEPTAPLLEPGMDRSAERVADRLGMSPQQFQNIIAFIKGDEGSRPGPAISGALNRAATDPEKLATLITEAAILKKREMPAGRGETLADIVVGCLRRTLDHVHPAPAEDAGDEGDISAQKSLLVLERMVMDKLRAMMGPATADAQRRLKQALRQAGERMEADLTAVRFMEARAELSVQEQQVIHLMRERGPEAFQGTILERGLAPGDGQRLVIRAGGSGAGGGGGGVAGMPLPKAISTLADVLGRFDSLMRAETPSSEEMRKLMGEIGTSVHEVAEDADERMTRLEEQWNQLRSRKAGAEGVERLMGRIAELTQELLQPITVIQTILNMLSDGMGVNSTGEETSDMLRLAKESGDQLKGLMDRLLGIVGLPGTLTPDFDLVYGAGGSPTADGPDRGNTAGS